MKVYSKRGCCEIPSDNTSPVDSTYEFTGITSRYELYGLNVNYIADYNFEEVQRSIGSGETVVDVSEVPGISTIIKTDAGKYYLEAVNSFEEITLPVGSNSLHIHQFGRYTIGGINYVYYGAGNNLYREPFIGFDNNFNGELIVEGQIFSDTGNLLTRLPKIS